MDNQQINRTEQIKQLGVIDLFCSLAATATSLITDVGNTALFSRVFNPQRYTCLIITISFLSFMGCSNEEQDRFQKTNVGIIIEQPSCYTCIPSFEELNRKHIYSTRNRLNATDIKSEFYCLTPSGELPICAGGYKVYFDPNQVIHVCDSLIRVLTKADPYSENNYKIQPLKKLKKQAYQSFKHPIIFDEIFLHDLLPCCRSNFWDVNTQTHPMTLIINVNSELL